MRLPILRGLSRLPRLLAFAAALGLVGSLAAIPLGPVETASAATTPGWYMIVSDYYDGTNGGDGTMRCLSANGQTSTSGSGTHSIYLAVCDPDTPGQWWRVLSTDSYSQLRNLQEWDGATWCLSMNWTTPSGGFSDTHGAYTTKCSSTTNQQKWNLDRLANTANTFAIENYYGYDDTNWAYLSTTSSSPYAGNLYKVFAAVSPSVTGSNWDNHWRLYAPTAPPS